MMSLVVINGKITKGGRTGTALTFATGMVSPAMMLVK